jgi:hypothetical protein
MANSSELREQQGCGNNWTTATSRLSTLWVFLFFFNSERGRTRATWVAEHQGHYAWGAENPRGQPAPWLYTPFVGSETHPFALLAGQNIRKLIKDGFVIRKPTIIHSRSRARASAEAKSKGRHTGYGGCKET